MNFGFSVLLRPGFFVFSVMTSISSVDTPVDRRRFVVFKCFCSLLGFHVRRLLLRRSIRRLPLQYGYIFVYFDVHSG